MSDPTRCPAAEPISGPRGEPAAKCSIMERDRERADSVLEGSPIGVIVSSRDDPTTYFGFCCGVDDPPVDVDAAYASAEAGEGRIPCNYQCCPVYRAGAEVSAAERVFGAATRPESPDEILAKLADELDVPVEALGGGKDDRVPTNEELAEMFGEGTAV